MIPTQHRLPVFLFWLKGYSRLLLLSLLAMTGVRLLWFFTYRRGDELTHFLSDFFKSLWLGMRFDLSAFCYLTLISLLLWIPWLMAGPTRWAPQILQWQRRLWVFLLTFLLLTLAADFAYYGYFQDHFNVLIFGLIQDDTIAILKTVWKNYPVIKITLGVILLYSLASAWLARLWHPPSRHALQPRSGGLWITLLVFVAVSMGARGSLGLFPLEIMHTAISSHGFLNTLSFNGAHAAVRAIQVFDQQRQNWNENLVQFGYKSQPEKAISDLTGIPAVDPAEPLRALQKKTRRQTPQAFSNSHVIVIVMESWGSDWMKEHSPEFNLLGAFAPHQQEDLFTPAMLPSSVATIGSLGSLLVDLPHRVYSPFLTESHYLGVEFQTAPAKLFAQQGYQTHFIYGGNPGWRSIDKFVPRQGFQKLHAEADIKNHFKSVAEANLLHDWGVYDRYVFEYTRDLLQKAEKPQFIFILTTTNHPPYSLPPDYQLLPQKIPDGLEKQLTGDLKLAHVRLKAYQYANEQLGQFLNSIKSGSLASRTIVAATGDHSFYIRPYENLEFFEKWAVPFYLYLPPAWHPSSTTPVSLASHIDIFPTLYNLVFSEVPYESLGDDLLSPNRKPWAFHAPSLSAFNEEHGIIVNAKGQIVSNLCRTSSTRIQVCANTEDHETLRRHFISLMGTADFIFERERLRRQTTHDKQ